MSGRPKGQRRQISNGTSENYEANSSPSVSNYNPIAMINKEINGEDCRQLLMKVDTMREILRLEKISLPEIVVVGDQSVGKSSILEAISGIELPRAQNICTRCPLELRMKSAPPDSSDYATIRYERQIIAVSKIDKHDKGIAEKLQGIGSGSLCLPLGCVAVLNRKQEEIDAGVSFEEMRRREAEFFRTNPAFTDVPQEYLGSQELIKKLVLIQQDRIRCTLPLVIEKVKEKIHTMREELKQIPSVILTETDTRIAFNEILRNYRRAVEQRVQGDYEIKSEKTGEKFNQHAREKWDDRIAYHLKMIGKCTSEEIQKILSKFTSERQKPQVLQSIEENYGGGLPNFPSSNIIQQLYQPYHKQLEKPCKNLVLWVEEYMTACLAYILKTVLPAEATYTLPLSRELNNITKDIIQHSKEKCMESVHQMLEMEEKVFTVNPYYLAIFKKLKPNES
ncbi:unnamed protein product [Adineta steineri]|uniref:Dynamin GTPase domain-containing protein n=1 Tax=Adineta steineri TaxID=433720 RepID=A0A815KFC3_9BILA|nr:unnamed protein product [Adineta steineri]CAF1392438.1 unnamed protein product [Adineta steineri]